MLKKVILLMMTGAVVLGLNTAAFSMMCGSDHGSMHGAGAKSADNKHGEMAGMDMKMPTEESPTKEITFEAYMHGYSPDKIIVKKDALVRLSATSRDVSHGIYIKEYGINEQIKKGETKTIEFIADKAGKFNILCSVYCGAGHNKMKGILIVED
ncbi:MAG: cupredoxin domain-containing protein [Candidatus Margulisiibacteriota bacterium]